MKCKEIIEEKCNINYYFDVNKYDFPMIFSKDQDNNTIDVIPHKMILTKFLKILVLKVRF